ncbi:MAG: hypothetical protein ACO35F_08795 [Ilumatobacteraceae bacterium]
MSILDDLGSAVLLAGGTVALAMYTYHEVFDAEIGRMFGGSWT